jgi:hypothetical protein
MKIRYQIIGVLISAVFGVTVFGQTNITASEKYLITAHAGGVNAITGEVMVEKADGKVARLIKGDEVKIGERVTTDADGRAEILMNPGSFIRLGANSSFEFVSTDLDDVRLKVHKGSAILEVLGTEGFHVDLSTDTARFTILDSGVYRIDADPNGGALVAVWRGRLRAGNERETIRGGKQVIFDGKTYIVNKFDRDEKDDLAFWSRERSKELSRISASLRPKQLRDPLINSFSRNRWDLYNSFGLWVYDPFFRSFCFLPFGYGWSSPYGFGFGRSIWFYNLPVAIYNQPPPAGTKAQIPVVPVEPSRSIAPPRDARKISDSGSSDNFRGVPRERPAEPRFDTPRIEPITPSMPAPARQPSKPRDN